MEKVVPYVNGSESLSFKHQRYLHLRVLGLQFTDIANLREKLGRTPTEQEVIEFMWDSIVTSTGDPKKIHGLDIAAKELKVSITIPHVQQISSMDDAGFKFN